MVGKLPEKQWKGRKSKSKVDFINLEKANRDLEQTISSQQHGR